MAQDHDVAQARAIFLPAKRASKNRLHTQDEKNPGATADGMDFGTFARHPR